MITDVFIKRYPETWFRGNGVPPELIKLFRQAAAIIFQDLKPYIDDTEDLCRQVHDKLVRERGMGLLRANTYQEICQGCLFEGFDVWNNFHGSPDDFVKIRLSLIELLFRELDGRFTSGRRSSEMAFFSFIKSRTSQERPEGESEEMAAFRSATQEFNQRLRDARLPLHYHNGFLQRADDVVSTSQIDEPFWGLMRDPLWKNVDADMKEAIDRRDSAGRDAALYALKALESVIKIISGEKGWDRGNERGAANYIDNLVSSTNGRFIEVWEAEALKALFRDLRNPHGHGPGADPLPSLTTEQQTWIIETSMSWIKSLIRRM